MLNPIAIEIGTGIEKDFDTDPDTEFDHAQADVGQFVVHEGPGGYGVGGRHDHDFHLATAASLGPRDAVDRPLDRPADQDRERHEAAGIGERQHRPDEIEAHVASQIDAQPSQGLADRAVRQARNALAGLHHER